VIRYTLKCGNGHAFDAWFGSSAAYETQRAEGLVACAVCGSGEVEKSVMAPAVAGGSAARDRGGEQPAGPLSAPANPLEAKLTALRRHIERTTEDVGRAFASEARRIHEGDAEPRAIRGEATGAEAKALVEDGIPVAPLPFPPKRQG
jgi:hypothetical protein